MPFDEQLADRARNWLQQRSGVSERNMFGGLAFLVNGNMCCGVHQHELIVRLDPAHTARALAEPNTRIFDLSGRPMQGWILVQAGGLEDERVLAAWLGLAFDFARSLPAKH